MNDFNEALSSLLPPEIKQSFVNLQNEQANDLHKNTHDIRIDPSNNDNLLGWSLSRWSNLRVSELLPAEPAVTNISQQRPREIEDMEEFFPEFATSYQYDNF